jgi:4-alpha-glucanotransferase
MDLFDLVRIDHFRGFVACWEIQADASTAAEGAWVSAPGEALFDALSAAFGMLPVVAEDLGVITPEVRTLRGRYGLPGMRVLHFGFDGSPHNPHLVHEHVANAVVYTGTHDNDTTLGWYASLPEDVRRHVLDYLGGEDADMPWPVIRLALASVCRLAMLPMQDVLSLDSACRMNTPGTTTGNWQWRFDWSQVTPDIVNRLRHLTHLYGRS